MDDKKVKTTKVESGAQIKVQVAPYPISIDLSEKEGAPVFKAQIVKLTDFGFLMKSDATYFYLVGRNYFCRFKLPVIDTVVSSEIKAIKTYDAIEHIIDGEKVKVYTTEMHFKSLDPKYVAAINSFLVQSGQKKKA